MKRVYLFTASVLFLLVLVGCTNQEKSQKPDWEATGTIELTAVTEDRGEVTAPWIGEADRIAITNAPFHAGEPQKYMWLLWGNEAELVGKPFKVIATNEKGEAATVFENELGGSNWGAPASSPSSLTLATEGLWKLEAYVEEKLHGSLIVEVV